MDVESFKLIPSFINHILISYRSGAFSTAMATNQAAWFDKEGEQLSIREASLPKAAAGRIVIRNKAVAINPVDWKIQEVGWHLSSLSSKAIRLIMLSVRSTTSSLRHFQTYSAQTLPGRSMKWAKVSPTSRKVIALLRKHCFINNDGALADIRRHAISLLSQDPADGAFQLYSSAVAAKAAKIPDSISFAQGSVLPLAFDTAAIGLYPSVADGGLGLPFPTLDPKPSGKTILVWGGSSSVGALTIQLAIASGVNVITTASQRNFDFCRKLGASEVFDYKSETIVEDVVKAVKSLGGTFAGVYDAIALEDQSFKYIVPMMEQLGGALTAVLPPPKGVKGGSIMGINDITVSFEMRPS
jgi:NADPH:quinone reductase-like Zn-dependent oxidoreductase